MNEVPLHTYVRMPYMVGAYLAVNSVPDFYIVVDGPDCLFFKAEFVHGAQDINSSLLDATSKHRIIHTVADTHKVVLDREDFILDLLRKVCSNALVGAVAITALPMSAITGSEYERLARHVREETGKPVFEVPAKSLQAGWLEGYAEVLAGLASALEFEGPGEEDCVAVVGLLLDRTEADNLANILELRRLIEDGLGLKIACFWPSNSKTARLAKVGKARIIVSLPYARKAARIIARRTGAALVETDVPFGIDGTSAFLRKIAEATSRKDRAEAFIRAEEGACAPFIQLAAERVAKGKRIGFIGDPHLAVRMAEVIERLYADFAAYLSTQYSFVTYAGLPGVEALATGDLDFCISTTLGLVILGQRHIPFLEFGFPCYGRHAFATVPYLGYRGALWFVETLINQMLFFKKLQSNGIFLPGPLPLRPL